MNIGVDEPACASRQMSWRVVLPRQARHQDISLLTLLVTPFIPNSTRLFFRLTHIVDVERRSTKILIDRLGYIIQWHVFNVTGDHTRNIFAFVWCQSAPIVICETHLRNVDFKLTSSFLTSDCVRACFFVWLLSIYRAQTRTFGGPLPWIGATINEKAPRVERRTKMETGEEKKIPKFRPPIPPETPPPETPRRHSPGDLPRTSRDSPESPRRAPREEEGGGAKWKWKWRGGGKMKMKVKGWGLKWLWKWGGRQNENES